MDELPGVDDYLTLLDKASEPLWRHEDLFKEPEGVSEDGEDTATPPV